MKHPVYACPHCGAAHDFIASLLACDMPNDGDVLICAACLVERPTRSAIGIFSRFAPGGVRSVDSLLEARVLVALASQKVLRAWFV